MLAKEYEALPDLKHWSDLWLADDKKAGYIAIANEKYHTINLHGLKGRNKMISSTKGVADRFISLNAFKVENWGNLAHTRSAENLKQIRTIGIDIDQYNKGLTIPEALDELNRLIRDEVIPKPNLILTSRGIQVFYSIKGGASPYKSGLTSYITAQFIQKMQHIGADGNAKDIARLMRVPNSINSRNGATVHPILTNNTSYTLWELKKFVDPYKPEEIKKDKLIIPINLETKIMLRTNQARIHDFNKIMELRNFDLTGKRNIMLYNYAFHLSLIEQNIEEVLTKVNHVFAKVKTSDPKAKPLDETEINATVSSAYDDAEIFIEWYKENDYKIVYKQNDGIIKPKKTSTLIDELDITIGEQHQLKTLVTDEIATLNKRKREKNRITKKRREKGTRPMSEYQEEHKTKQQQRLEQLEYLMNKYPNYTNKQYAEIMEVSLSTLKRLKRKIN